MSKLLYFDFTCPDGHQFEELVKPTANTAKCPYCSKKGKRLVSAPSLDWKTMGLDRESFPTLADKWERIQRQKAKADNYQPNLKMY